MSAVIAVRVDAALKAKLVACAKAEERSVAQLIRYALRQYLAGADREALVRNDPGLRAAIDRGLAEAACGDTVDLGGFSEYGEEQTDESRIEPW